VDFSILTYLYGSSLFDIDEASIMKISLNLQDDLLKQAMEATGLTEKTDLIHLGLKALIQKAARERLIKLQGTQRSLAVPRRHRKV
jgi:Arc/MetJ family transcription regulator